MSEQYITVAQMIIFPNTMYKHVKAAFIISAKTLHVTATGKKEWAYYIAVTDTRSVYDDFWNDALSDEQKVPAITHMLNCLAQNNGEKFRYIQPSKTDDL